MKYIFLFFFFISFNCYSNYIKYENNFENSEWINTSSKLFCSIEHEIDNFGIAKFHKKSGNYNYTFEFDFFIKPQKRTESLIYLLPNYWQRQPTDYKLFSTDIYSGYNIFFEGNNVNLLLNNLEQGYKIGFFYEIKRKTNFILNNINFQQSYNKFKKCISNLLPYSFLDIQQTILNFENNSIKLTKESQSKLNKLIEYIKEDSDFDSVIINSYSDSYGTRNKNLEISKERRNHIINQLLSFGLNKDIITGKAFGERHFITNNDTKENRLLNRRVTINLIK